MEQLTNFLHELNRFRGDWILRAGPDGGWILDLCFVLLLYDHEERLVGEYYHERSRDDA